MRVLLDEHLPVDFAAKLKGHEVSTVRAQGWIGMKNGELLTTAAAAGFEVLLTNDRGIEQQQRLTELSLAVIILDAKTQPQDSSSMWLGNTHLERTASGLRRAAAAQPPIRWVDHSHGDR